MFEVIKYKNHLLDLIESLIVIKGCLGSRYIFIPFHFIKTLELTDDGFIIVLE